MKRNFVLVGTWASVVSVAALCLAVDPKRSGNPSSPPPSQSNAPPTGGMRYAPQPSYRANQAAQQAAASAAAARAAAANAQRNYNNQPSQPSYRNWRYGYGYSGYYSPYGYSYSPYGYGYPPGTTPYVLGYDPSTGSAFLYPYGGGYSPYSPGYGYQYPYYRNSYLGYGYPGAVFVNPGQLYGIGPIQQLMGLDGGFQQGQANPNFGNGAANQFANGNGPNANGANGNGANGNGANANAGLANNANAIPNPPRPGADPAARKPVAGGKAMEIAWKFITYGDAHFGNQKYNDALDRYRRATHECPKLSDAWFREGFALAALGRYDLAATAMRRGLEEKPDWPDNNFRLSEVYGDDATEKKAILDKMIKAAEAQPTNGNLAYVVGVHLYCDGKPDEAAPFFRRAAQILGSDADMKAFQAK